jgi:hypothetical protein
MVSELVRWKLHHEPTPTATEPPLPSIVQRRLRGEARHSRGPRRFRPVGGEEAVAHHQHRDDAAFSTASKPLDPYRPRGNSEAGQLLVQVVGTMRVLRHDEFSKESVAPAAEHSGGKGAGRDCYLGQQPKTAPRATAWRKDLLHSRLP